MKTAYERLVRWRDVGDGPAAYVSGSRLFTHDVIELLKERDDMLEALSLAQPIVSDRAAGGRMLVSVSRAQSALSKIISVVTKAEGAAS